MTIARSVLPLLMATALTVACDSGTKDAKPAPAAAAKKADDGKAPTEDAKDAAPPSNPHAAANPHANMPPMMGAPPKPAGPPRDITPSGETTAETLPDLALAVPKEWEKGTPSNKMRVAQWVLPGPGGDAELVVFRFPGGGGSIEANLTRWKGQFTPPEGKTIDDVSTTKEIAGEGLKTTLVDVSGTYSGGMGSPAPQPDARMLAAIAEGKGDPYFFKAVGPQKTIDLWAEAYSTMIGSFAVSGAEAPGGEAPSGDAEAKAPEKAGEG